AGAPDALYERHLKFDDIVDPPAADASQRYGAAARAVRDILSERWVRTDQTYERENPKRVYYVSIEFLIGRSLSNNIMNLRLDPVVDQTFDERSRQWMELLDKEPDAGLGNGGLGRLAACFLDSMATLALPAIGYGLRYEYGVFRPEIPGGRQGATTPPAVRDFPPADRRGPPGRAPRPLPPPSRPLGGQPPEGGRGGWVELRLPVEG